MAGNLPLTAEEALEIREFAHRTPIYLSSDGRLIGYTVRVPEQAESVQGQAFSASGVVQELVGSEVYVQDLENDTVWSLTDQWGASWGAGWSPDNNNLLFLSDRGGKVRAWIWDADKDQTRLLCDATISSFFGYDVPLWMSDGNRVLIKEKIEPSDSLTAEKQPADQSTLSSSVTVFSSDDVSQLMEEPLSPRLTPAGNQVPIITDRHLYNLGLVDLRTDTVQRLAEGFRGGAIVPSYDGSRVAVLSVSSEDQRTRRHAYELYLVDVEKQSYRLVSQDIFPPEAAQCLSWSPNNSKLALISEGDLLIYELDADLLRRPTEGLQLDYKSCEPPLWNTEGTHIYFISHGRLYRIFVTDGQVEILGDDMERLVVSVVRRNGILMVDESQGILLQTLDSSTGHEGTYLLNRGSRKECLFEKDVHIGGLSVGNTQLAHYTDCTPDYSQVVCILQRADMPPDIWLTDFSFEDRKKVTAINPHLDRSHFGRAEFIDYVLSDGERRKGVLLKPPREIAEPPYPLIVSVYPSWSHREKQNLFGGVLSAEGNPQLYATTGYAVLWPDMTGSHSEIINDAVPLVLPAVDKVIELGLADSSRMGIVGHSAGGYAVCGLVTQTNRFSAAVSMSGVSDMISCYGYMWPDGSVYRQKEQEQLYGGPPWEVPQIYLENSPLMYVGRVNAPMLFIHGDRDDASGWQVAAEMFTALRRLGKKAEFALYRGEGHIPGDWSSANKIDLWNRILDWFNIHLGR